MLTHGILGSIVAVLVIVLGVDLLLTEQSPVKWIGLLAIIGGIAVALRSWVAMSVHAEETIGKQPAWHIQRVLGSKPH